jgi:transposase
MRYGVWGSLIKKTLRHPRASDVARHIFQQRIEDYQNEGRIIVYIDESGFAHDMPRTHGYSASGQRCIGLCDWQARGRTNVIGALIGKLLVTAGFYQTTINADIFLEWIKNDLVPKLPLHSIIVMDNSTFHKRKDIQDTIKSAGHTLEYLPVYSPDLNPIENKWAHIKSLRRKFMCSIPQLFKIEPIYLT